MSLCSETKYKHQCFWMKIIKIYTEKKCNKQPQKYELLLVLSLDVFHSAVRENA